MGGFAECYAFEPGCKNIGHKSVLTIQGDDEAYPDYHKESDVIENVDLDYATKIIKMNMGGLLRMAGVRSGKTLRGSTLYYRGREGPIVPTGVLFYKQK